MQMHAKKSENQHQENDDLWAQPIGLGGNIGDLDLFGDWQDLKRYKIVDAMSSKVLLARDQLQSGSTVALKVVRDASISWKPGDLNNYPGHVIKYFIFPARSIKIL